MKSRSARLALLVLFVLALGVTAYLFRKGEIARRAETAAADVFNAKARSTSRGILELRAAQQAYVATGQGEDFWAARVTSTLTSLKDLTEDKEIPVNSMVELTDGKRLLLSKDDGGRIVNITMANK